MQYNIFTLKSTLFTGYFFLHLLSFSQTVDSHYNLDTILCFRNIEVTTRVDSKVKYNIEKNEAKCLYKTNNEMLIEIVNLISSQRTIKKIKNKTLRKLNANDIHTFSTFQDNIIIGTQYSIYGYSLKTNKLFLELDVQSIRYSYMDESRIYMGRYYNFHYLSNVYDRRACVYSYNLKTRALDSIVLKDNFIEYTHYMPSHLISFGKFGFIYPDLGSYKIYIVDSTLKQTDSVYLNKEEWIYPLRELSKLVAVKDNINTYFTLLDKENFEHISRIEFVEILDSSQFLVRWFKYDTTFKRGIRNIDIWTKKEGKFELSESFIETKYPIQIDSSIAISGIPLKSEAYYTHYNRDYLIQFKSELELDPRKFKTYKQYLISRQEFGKSNDPILSIWIYKKI